MYQPILMGSGIVGWNFLKKTYSQQIEIFSKSSEIKRNQDHFVQSIGKIETAADLVSDRQTLLVALTAFGLQEDINNKYLIQRILEEGSTADDALANRFADKRYLELSKAFGFGPGETQGRFRQGFAESIISSFRATAFESAVGDQDEKMRISLYAERKIGEVVSQKSSLDAKWFSIIGQPPLREVFQVAFGLPEQFSQIDVDQQLRVFKERSKDMFGTNEPDVLFENNNMDKLINAYIARSQLQEGASFASSASVALTLLSSTGY